MNKFFKYEVFLLSLYWLVFLFLCIVFYKERSTYADNSYYLFEIIQHKTFCIQYDRFFSITTQFLPLLAVKLQLPLNIVMYAFSVNPLILYFSVFLCIRYLSHEKWLSYIYLLSLLITVHHSFFYVNDELNQAAGLLILMVAVLRSEKLNRLSKIVALLMVLTGIQFAHLFLVIAAASILFIYFIEKKELTGIIGIVFTITIVLIRAVLFKSGRDGSSIDSLDWKFITFKNLYTSPFAVFFKNMLWQYYLPAVVLMLTLFVRSHLSFITKLFSFFVLIGMYIVLLVFLRNGASLMYNDKYLAVWFLICWSIIAIDINTQQSDKNWIYAWVFIATLFSFAGLWKENYYTKRIDYLKTMMRQKAVKQIYVFEEVPDFLQTMSWSIPYETLFISSLEGETKTILIKEHFYKINEYLQDSTVFLGAEWTFGKPVKLNRNYFNLRMERYKYVN